MQLRPATTLGFQIETGDWMQRYRAYYLAPLAVLALGACHFPHLGKTRQPAGQVAATVDGQEVTLRDLNAELGAANLSDPKMRRNAEQYALRAIISRKILASAARAQGLDKTPEFAIQREKAIETLLVQALAAKIVAAVPAPTPEEAQSFISAHPDSFAARKIFTLDEIRTAQPIDSAIQAAMKPLNSVDAVAALFDKDHVQYRRGTADVDALALDPRVVDQIVKLPAGTAFNVPTNGFATVAEVKQSRIVPFSGQAATNYALQVLRREHAQEAVDREFSADMKKAAVAYNKAYAPAPPVKAASPASNATAK